jgi:hypothetical protein
MAVHTEQRAATAISVFATNYVLHTKRLISR